VGNLCCVQVLNTGIFSAELLKMKREQQKIFDKLFLSALYKRPPPLWHHPDFLHHFGDAYLANTALEGGQVTVRPFPTLPGKHNS
jgi:hypothetical protein